MRSRIAIGMSLICVALGGACGSIATRGEAMFGAYPGQAVVYDFTQLLPRLLDKGVDTSGVRFKGPWMILPWSLNLPLDLFYDTLFLPVDLVAWVFGSHKSVPSSMR